MLGSCISLPPIHKILESRLWSQRQSENTPDHFRFRSTSRPARVLVVYDQSSRMGASLVMLMLHNSTWLVLAQVAWGVPTATLATLEIWIAGMTVANRDYH
jgi:hypothetical protein